jgi:hypothetical protein
MPRSIEVTDTGIRGYLKWLQADQPQLYQYVAQQLPYLAPGAFSDGEQSRAMAGLGDDLTFQPSTTADSGLTLAVPTLDPNLVAMANQTDTASAANQGTSSPDITSTITSLITGATQGLLAVNQVDTLKQVNAIQLQRAQAGLPPLNTSSLNLGVPSVNLGLSSGTLQAGGIGLAVVAGLAVLFLLAGGSKKAA